MPKIPIMRVRIQDRSRLRLDDAPIVEINAQARAEYPHEACGLLIGREADGRTLVERIVSCRNLAVDRLADRYVLDPDDFRAADEAARKEGLDIVGIWHTHPDHPARPSETDLEAAWPEYCYLIVSVTSAGVAEHRAWRLEDERFIEQEIEENETWQT